LLTAEQRSTEPKGPLLLVAGEGAAAAGVMGDDGGTARSGGRHERTPAPPPVGDSTPSPLRVGEGEGARRCGSGKGGAPRPRPRGERALRPPSGMVDALRQVVVVVRQTMCRAGQAAPAVPGRAAGRARRCHPPHGVAAPSPRGGRGRVMPAPDPWR